MSVYINNITAAQARNLVDEYYHSITFDQAYKAEEVNIKCMDMTIRIAW